MVRKLSRDLISVDGVTVRVAISTELEATSDSSSDSEDVESSSVSSASRPPRGGGCNVGTGRERHLSLGTSHCSWLLSVFFVRSGFLPPSHDIHETLLLERKSPSSSLGVRRLFDPLDEEDDDSALSEGAVPAEAPVEDARRVLVVVLRVMVPNSRDGLLESTRSPLLCESLAEATGIGEGLSERLAPNTEDIPRIALCGQRGV